MDYETADKILWSFSGYSPALPPPINSSILTLFRGVADPERAVDGQERVVLEQYCEMALSVLHESLLNSPHDEALRVLRAVSREGGDFAVYLRNFDLGARRAGPRTPVQVLAERLRNFDGTRPRAHQIPAQILADRVLMQQDFVVNMEDDEFQRKMIEHLGPRAAIVGVENAVLEFHREGGLPRLSLEASSWEPVVDRLVASGATIIVFIDDLTAGISSELAMIRARRRQRSTLIVTKTRLPNGFEDFPVVIEWDAARSEELFAEGFRRIIPRDNAVSLDLSGLELHRPQPPENVRQAADTLIDVAFTGAAQALQAGSLDAAIDDLIAATAASFWSGNVAARGVAYKRLAMVQHQRGRVGFAVENLRRFVDLVEASESSGPNLLPVLFGLQDLVRDLGEAANEERIQQLLARFRALENMARGGSPTGDQI